MKKFLSDNRVDTNATVLQNSRSFLDHVPNAFKDQIVLYETRDDMERIPPDVVDTNAFSNMVIQKQKEWNDAHPDRQADGGDVRLGRFECIPDKIVLRGLTARRHLGTKTVRPTGTVLLVLRRPARACGTMHTNLLYGGHIKHTHSFQNSKISMRLLAL